MSRPGNYLSRRYLIVMLTCAVVAVGLVGYGLWLVARQEFMSYRAAFVAVLSVTLVVIVVFIVRAGVLLYRTTR